MPLDCSGMKSGLETVLVLVLVLPVVNCSRHSRTGEDPRLIVFHNFNHASTYGEIKPQISGLLARLFADFSTKPDEMRKAMNYLQVTSFERAHMVDVNPNTTFLVLENVTSNAVGREKRRAYLLSRIDGNHWTVAAHLNPQMAVPSCGPGNMSPASSTSRPRVPCLAPT